MGAGNTDQNRVAMARTACLAVGAAAPPNWHRTIRLPEYLGVAQYRACQYTQAIGLSRSRPRVAAVSTRSTFSSWRWPINARDIAARLALALIEPSIGWAQKGLSEPHINELAVFRAEAQRV